MNEAFEERIIALEKKCNERIFALENKCKILESEKKDLRSKLEQFEGSKKDLHEKDTDVADAKVLLNNKKSGFERLSPQAVPENKNREKEFNCNQCSFKLESQGLLFAHMQTHIDIGSKNKCDYCGKIFWIKIQLESHIKTNHAEEGVKKAKQYNCKDCPFQGENSLELKKHIQRTNHIPCEYFEECYTCNKEFPSYRLLMNHRKTDHPSSRLCRYFQIDECNFDAETCWYKHELKTIHAGRKEVPVFQCNECDDEFGSQSVLMKHKKKKHPDKISKCKDFAQGKCKEDGNTCWFDHPSEQMETDEAKNESVFQEAQIKTPPDQMASIMMMIERLSVQVEHLEKRTMKKQ